MDQLSNRLMRLLLCSGQNDSLLAMQSAVFSQAGHTVVTVAAKEAIQEQIENTPFDVVVLNHTLSFSERKLLARKIKTAHPSSGVLVLHHSGALGNPFVDLAVDSRTGAQAVLKALDRVETMLHARTHYSGPNGDEYVVVVDANRHYIYASDAACRLLGYDRAMFLELRIDDVVAGATRITEPLFQDFVKQGRQSGHITLRHRSGQLVPVNYPAQVYSDGCMVAKWAPLESSAEP